MVEKQASLENYYQEILDTAHLLTKKQAMDWSSGVLKTLGTNLPGGTKRRLAKTLPKELASSLKSAFYLVNFRDPDLTSYEFRRLAARRSGHSDAEFAMKPTLAVFRALKDFIEPELDQNISRLLQPEISEMWNQSSQKSSLH